MKPLTEIFSDILFTVFFYLNAFATSEPTHFPHSAESLIL